MILRSTVNFTCFNRQAADLNRGLGASATQQAVVQSFLRNFDQVMSIFESKETVVFTCENISYSASTINSLFQIYRHGQKSLGNGTNLHFWRFCTHARREYNFTCPVCLPTSLGLDIFPEFQHCIGWGGGTATCF